MKKTIAILIVFLALGACSKEEDYNPNPPSTVTLENISDLKGVTLGDNTGAGNGADYPAWTEGWVRTDETTPARTPISSNLEELQGKIAEEITLDATKMYDLKGSLIVENGGKLVIPAGTTIVASGGTASYIAVSQGGKIEVNGTKDNPVVITSSKENPKSGDWGGVVICGKAPTNKGGSNGETATAEVSDLIYGGSDSEDSSGIIKYLRIEYSGATFTGEKEFNGLSLFAVGSGTTIDYVQSYKGSDDGIEFFGGTVKANHMVSIESEDDGIDFADGFSGSGEFWYIKNAVKAGLEGSNNGSDPDASPETTATLKNISIVTEAKADEGAMFYKEGGGKWNFENIVVSGYNADNKGAVYFKRSSENELKKIVQSSFFSINKLNLINDTTEDLQ